MTCCYKKHTICIYAQKNTQKDMNLHLILYEWFSFSFSHFLFLFPHFSIMTMYYLHNNKFLKCLMKMKFVG